jgi:tetratricopeptide (TPR) repeat protein
VTNHAQGTAQLTAAEAYEAYCSIADQHYENRLLDSAITYYRQAASIAERFSYEEGISTCRSWVGTCLFQLGRFTEALTELSPFLDRHSQQRSPTIFNAHVQYIQSAQRLPVSLATIERAYQGAEDWLRSVGKIGWRDELFVHRARLELARGETTAALASAQEAIVLKGMPSHDGAGQVWDFHYDGLIDVSLAVADANAAETYFEEWMRRPDQMPANRRIRKARCLADLRRFQKRYSEAARWATVALEEALETDYLEVRIAAFQSFIRSRLVVGSFQTVRPVIASYVRDAFGESRLERYTLYLLVGDYHLATARAILTKSFLDDQYDQPEVQPLVAPINRGAMSALRAAERAYRKAARIGTDVDAKLQCNLRVKETKHRLLRCAMLKA